MNKTLPLIVPKEEVIKKLNKQLVAGKSLHKIKPEESSASVASLLHKIENWKTSSFTVLSESFAGNEVTSEFNRISNFHKKISGGYIEQHHEIQKLLSTSLQFIQTTLSSLSVMDNTIPNRNRNSIFIVHGHDNAVKQEVARFILDIGKKPIILHEQTNGGQTIIEKFSNYSEVPFAIILLTPDDIGYPVNSETHKKSRARQNVIFEFGFFVAKIGRNRVCVLHKGDVEIPSDLQGVAYIAFDDHGGWKNKVIKEMIGLGIKVKQTFS
jgi:predicted nucleotide-binding protein